MPLQAEKIEKNLNLAHTIWDMYYITVKVTPNAGRDEVTSDESSIIGQRVLHVKTCKAPNGGQANTEVIKIVANYLQVAKSRISIVNGEKSRIKILKIQSFL